MRSFRDIIVVDIYSTGGNPVKRLLTVTVVLLVICILTAPLSFGESVGVLNSTHGPVVLLKTSTIDVSEGNIVNCTILNGTKAAILETKDYANVPGFWIKVEIRDGDCQGVIGWTQSANFKLLN